MQEQHEVPLLKGGVELGKLLSGEQVLNIFACADMAHIC